MASYSDALKRIYGTTPAAVEANLVPVTLDWPCGDGKTPQSVTVRVNRHVMAARLRLVNEQMKAFCVANHVGYTLHDVECFCWRNIRGGSSLSMHSGAIAVDINPAENPLGLPLRTNIHPWMVTIFQRNGFKWGGSFLRCDPMHFELCIHTEPVAAVRTRMLINANLRATPSLTSRAVAYLHAGDVLTVLGTSGLWANLRDSHGRVGYVMRVAQRRL